MADYSLKRGHVGGSLHHDDRDANESSSALTA